MARIVSVYGNERANINESASMIIASNFCGIGANANAYVSLKLKKRTSSNSLGRHIPLQIFLLQRIFPLSFCSESNLFIM